MLSENNLPQNAENQNGNPAKTAGSNSNSASVLNVAQNALLSSGFDVKSEKNLRFSLKNGGNAPQGNGNKLQLTDEGKSIDKNSKKIYSLELTESSQSGLRSDSGAQSKSNYTHIEYFSDVVDKLHQKHEKIKSFLEKNQENLRFAIAPQVDTPEFKNYFKDSKVVDENGEPLIVYHGTNADL